MKAITKKNDESRLVPYTREWDLFEDLDRMMLEVFDTWKPVGFSVDQFSGIDVLEEKDGLVVKTSLPGINKKDLDITVQGDQLIIKAEKKGKVTGDKKHEKYYREYLSTVTLPYPVKEERISANLGKGVLEMRLPKAEKAAPKRIEVKAQLPEAKQAKTRKEPKQKSN